MKSKRNQKREEHVLNERIRGSEVRVVSSDDLNGLYKTGAALSLAKSENKDLILINPKADPPVCKIQDYGKFKYEDKKRSKANKEGSKAKPIKELKFGPNTGDHDFEFKLKNAKTFIEKGHKVKAYVQFRGREMAFKEKGELMLLKFAEALEGLGKVEGFPQMNGKKMFMTIAPKGK